MCEDIVRVLHVLPAINFCGGIEKYVMSYYRHIDRSKIQFDFITHTNLKPSYKDEILSLGGRVYEMPIFSLRNLPIIIFKLLIFFYKNNNYSIIHCHMANAAFIYFTIAIIRNIKIRILHSHQPSASDKIWNKLRNYPLLKIGNYLANQRLACSKEAGEFLFGRKKFNILKNAIEYRKFLYYNNIRDKLRDKYKLSKNLVIGNVGRLTEQKNQSYLIDIFNAVLKRREDAVLIIIGEGHLYPKLFKKTIDYGINDKVFFLGTMENVNELYNMMDVFVFPSLYEGLGIVLIEAQCNGLKCIANRAGVPRSAKISNLLAFLSLNEKEKWVNAILSNTEYQRNSQTKNIKRNGYDVYLQANQLMRYYLDLYAE